MTYQQKQQLTFIHHSLWCFAQNLPKEYAELIADINVFRSAIVKHIPPGEDAYCHNVPKGGVLLLNETIP